MSAICRRSATDRLRFAGKSVGAGCAYWPRCMHPSPSSSSPQPAHARTHLLLWTSLALALSACGGGDRDKPASNTPSAAAKAPEASAAATLTLGAYTTPREAYGKAILPAFAKLWADKHGGQKVEFRESYLGSGAQARAITSGFEADVAALSLEP